MLATVLSRALTKSQQMYKLIKESCVSLSSKLPNKQKTYLQVQKELEKGITIQNQRRHHRQIQQSDINNIVHGTQQNLLVVRGFVGKGGVGTGQARGWAYRMELVLTTV